MNISDILNHPQQQQQQQQQTSQRRMSCFSPVNGRRLSSPPLSPLGYERRLMQVHGKPRSRFSDVEDTIICEGVAKGLTWGQISRQLPHRKRATCFNRYRTLQGIRKSRKRSTASILEQNEQQQQQQRPVTPPTSPGSSHSASSSAASLSPSWYPCTPPAPVMSSSTPDHHQQHQLLPSPHQLLFTSHDMAAPCYPERRLSSTTSVDSDDARLPPLIVPSARYATTITTATKTTAT